MNRLAKGLLIVTTNSDGFNLANHRQFAKFAELSIHQTLPLYSNPQFVLMCKVSWRYHSCHETLMFLKGKVAILLKAKERILSVLSSAAELFQDVHLKHEYC